MSLSPPGSLSLKKFNLPLLKRITCTHNHHYCHTRAAILIDMNIYQNPKVVGAFLVGFALVAGAYVVSDFGEPRSIAPANVASAETAPARVFIPVGDQNIDGVEDWREQFVSDPVRTSANVSAADYVPPTTLTGKLGVNLMEGLILSKGAAPISRPQETVVADTVEEISRVATADPIFDVKDIIMSDDLSDLSIRLYGNTLAEILLSESKPELENELLLLRDYLAGAGGDPTELKALAAVYKSYRDRTLNTPVPKYFVKEHLDLINVYNAMYLNIDTMTKADEDPMLTLARLKRYEDDVNGMSMAFSNMYKALEPYARVFEMNDAAIIFVNFYQAAP
jgi:hypothetical protein